MKKLLLIVLVPLLFLACENAKNNSSTTSAAVSKTENAVICLENQQVVNGQCVCITGYKFNDQGVCMMEEIKLAKPAVYEGLNVIGENVWGFHYEPIKDVNGALVSSAVTRTEHLKLQNPGSNPVCTEYFARPQMGCTDGSTYTGNIAVPNGCFCLRAVNCADGYQKSDTYAFTVCISNSALEGDF